MNKKIGIIASDIELKNSILELYSEDIENSKILIDLLDSENMDMQGKILQKKGAKAIIARSGGYRHIQGTVDVPIVRMEISAVDILQGIRKASRFGKKIVLILWDKIYFNYNDWKEILNVDIELEIFSEKEEIKNRVYKYKDNKDEYVILGSGIACEFARKWSMEYVFINASKDSIHKTIEYTKNLIDDVYEEKFNSEILKTILHGVHDAVVAIDINGKVIMYNKMAEELLKKDSMDIINKNINDVLPELDFMLEALNEEENKLGKIELLKSLEITTNTSMLRVEGELHGVICSFQDITKLQKLEKKIRYELNKKGLIARYNFSDIMAKDISMIETVNRGKKVAKSNNTVMIYGESGTGKEMMAQSIHNASNRNNSPFVAINCAAISETLLESELFGYEEGAFTGARKGGKLGLFELAHGGTIFLDEINSISLNLQAKLLRVLEEKEVMRIGSDYVIPLDVRIIAAANEELKAKVEEGSFRRDLFYRLSIIDINLPPLRVRREDILPLFNTFIKEIEGDNNTKLSEELEMKLKNYYWPGNVRELKNIAQRYIMFNEVNIDQENIITTVNSEGNGIEADIENIIDLKKINKYVEDQIIENLMNKGMTKTNVAKMLGISRTSLWKKLNK